VVKSRFARHFEPDAMATPAQHAHLLTEADTCRELVTPKLVAAGWNSAPCAIGEQRSFTQGRISAAGGQVRRGRQKRADYLLYSICH